MEQRARFALEATISDLERGLIGHQMDLVGRADQLSDEQVVAAKFLVTALAEVMARACKIIYGTNVLTPSLTSKGWRVWRRLPVSETEKEWLLTAISKFEECSRQVATVTQELEQTRQYGIGKQMEVITQLQLCFRQFTEDLKLVVRS